MSAGSRLGDGRKRFGGPSSGTSGGSGVFLLLRMIQTSTTTSQSSAIGNRTMPAG